MDDTLKAAGFQRGQCDGKADDETNTDGKFSVDSLWTGCSVCVCVWGLKGNDAAGIFGDGF